MEELKQENAETQSEGQKFLFVTVNGIEYGVEIELIQEIIVMQKVSPIPSAKPFCKGVINIRGTIVPVIDLRIKIGLEPCEYDELACIVVVMIEGERIGMIVEKVNDVLQFELSQLQESPAKQDCGDRECISSKIAKLNGEVKQIMNMRKVFGLEPQEKGKAG